MSDQNGNEQEFVHLTPVNDKNSENDKQQKKMKPLTAFVQIVFDGPANGQEVKLSQNCLTVAEHAAFLLGKINQSQGNLIGFQLNGPVALASVLEGNVALMDHDVPLEVDCKYTFRFKLASLPKKEENVPDPVEELAKQMAQLAEEKEDLKEQVGGLAGKMAQVGEEQAKKLAKCQDQLKDLKNSLEKQLGEQAMQKGQVEKLEKQGEELKNELEKCQKLLDKAEEKAKLKEEQRMTSAEYARLLGVPNVANLDGNYNRAKLLQLLEHGNNIPSMYIQDSQKLKDAGIVQSIVDLLATAEKPEKMVGQVKIEYGPVHFDWPKRDELKLKEKKSKVAITFNEASANPKTFRGSDRYLAEYELINRGFRFQVLIHYWDRNFNESVSKFIYRRLT